MSAPVSDDVLRELGASVRRFPTATKCFLWYCAQRRKRFGKAMSFEVGGICSSEEEKTRSSATYARIARCLVPHDEEIDENPAPLPQNAAWFEQAWNRRLDRLVLWMVSERSQQRLADELGKTMGELENYSLDTLETLRLRMKRRQLLKERE